MSLFLILIIAVGGIVSVLLFTTVYFYNRLVRSRISVREAVAGIDVQLKRRHDLIPNLVTVVKNQGHYDQNLISALEAVPQFSSGMGLREKLNAEFTTGRTLRTVMDTAKAMPDLAGSRGFLDLQENLVKIEAELQMARRYYNALVRDHNSLCETFPSGIFASLLGIKREPFYEVDDETSRNPNLA